MPLLVVAIAAYQTSTSTIEQNAQGFSAQLTGEVRDNLDTYVRQAERRTYWPLQQDDIQTVLNGYQRPRAGSPGFNDVITAAVVGGTLHSGGVGTMRGTTTDCWWLASCPIFSI